MIKFKKAKNEKIYQGNFSWDCESFIVLLNYLLFKNNKMKK